MEDLIKALKDLSKSSEAITPQLKEAMKALIVDELPESKPNVSALNKELTSYGSPPRLPTFSGKGKPGNGETTYDLWRYEVLCLLREKTHTPELIKQAVRRSLKGDAGKVVMRLGPHATLPQILEKMDNVFGVVDEKESVMREFYNATQHEDEDITAWSFRLEDILEKAIQTDKVNRSEADKMLHDMLWKGLRPDFKAISHYEKEKYTTFDSLRAALRRIEKDNNLDKPALKLTRGTSKKAVVRKEEHNVEKEEDEEDDFSPDMKKTKN